MSDPKKPGSPDQTPMDDHEYDGIRELDNPAPFWWQLCFYLSIAFAFGYYIYYEASGKGPSSVAEIEEQLTEVRRLQIAARQSGPDESALLALLKDAAQLQGGREAYVARCAACHGADGGGLIGPNLTDAHWLHGKGKIGDVFKVIQDGVPANGMPAWGMLMSEVELKQVAAFAYSLKGTKPQNPKAPQGEEVKD